MELGVYTFAEVTLPGSTGPQVSAAQQLSDLMEEMELADQVGLDVFGLGEHHRADFAISAPAVVLAAAAQRTNRLKTHQGGHRAQLRRPGAGKPR